VQRTSTTKHHKFGQIFISFLIAYGHACIAPSLPIQNGVALFAFNRPSSGGGQRQRPHNVLRPTHTEIEREREDRTPPSVARS
jgi:hypothetical protein